MTFTSYLINNCPSICVCLGAVPWDHGGHRVAKGSIAIACPRPQMV